MNLINRLLRRKPCGAVIVAAGAGTRMEGIDKIMADLAGRPVLAHTIGAFEAAQTVEEIVVVARHEQVETVRQMIAEYGFLKIKDVVPGGQERIDSVEKGLKALSGKMDLAAVHDGARPLVTPELIDSVVRVARKRFAAAPGTPVKDTVKVVDEEGKVLSTPDRETLRAVQTPQVFQKDLLRAAWKKVRKDGVSCTDDCGAMEHLGKAVYLVEGSEENLKITTPMDLTLAESILAGRKTP